MKTFQTYPEALRTLEEQAIQERRQAADLPAQERDGAAIGLSLSGGGIRSATFCLGFLQAMAARGLIRRIDWLSTVSGGGYVGTFLGRFYDRLRAVKPTLPPDTVEQALATSASREIGWLRRHGEYLAPAGRSDLIYEIAIFLRNFLTLQFVLGLLLFGLYGIANAIRYGFFERVAAILPFIGGLSWSDLPIGYIVNKASLGIFWSPWFMLFELFLLLGVLPQGIGYWLASQDEVESFSRPTLILVFAAIIGLLWAAVRNGLQIQLVLAAVPLLLSFWAVEKAWSRVRRVNDASGTGGSRVEQLRARTELTEDLALYISIAAVLGYFALVDTIGHGLFEWFGGQNASFGRAFAALGAGLLALLPIVRGAALLVANRAAQQLNPGRIARIFSNPLVSGAIAAVLMMPPLLVISYAAHAAFNGGNPAYLKLGIGLALTSLVFSAVLATRPAMSFINRSSLQASYAARLARAYLGASNPRHADQEFDQVLPGDDVDDLTDYKPHAAGGPFHLINCCVNQTVDQGTLRSVRARQGTGMVCTSIGVTVSKYFHAVWAVKEGRPTVAPIGHVTGTPHPLLGADNEPPDTIEMLPLRDWMSISGAAFGTGLGQANNPAISVLCLIANLRTGYWWNSGLSAADRGSRPDVSFVRRLLWLLSNCMPTQARLLDEANCRFFGPWNRYWYLSDGGHFENLGGYELVRRRVPYFVMLDATADADYDFDDFANFERKIRIDFGATIEPFGQAQWAAQTTADVASCPAGQPQQDRQALWTELANHVAVDTNQDGPFDRLLHPPAAGTSARVFKRCASLLRVTYPDGRRPSVVLYVKASLDGEEPADVKQYSTANPDFPHESTAEQFFNESQWESYRRLGQHVGDGVLGNVGRAKFMWLAQLK